MSKRIIELRQKRSKLIADARALNDQIQSENRDYSAEEQQRWDAMMTDADKVRESIEREERMMTAEMEAGGETGNRPYTDNQRENVANIEWRSRGMRAVENGWQEQPEWRALLRTATPEYVGAFNRYLRGEAIGSEVRALQVDVDTQGGYLVAPMQMVDQLLKGLDDAVYMRQWATVFAVPNAQSLGVPTLENDPADADWTTELQTGSEDGTMNFGRRALHPHPLAKRIKISNTLIRKVPNSESLVRGRLVYKFGITEEKAYLTGSGAGQPLGIFTAHTDGIPTSRDVSTDNTTTAVTVDGLINAKYALKMQYWARARWMAHRDFYKMVIKLKDGDGQYLWRESVRDGEPDRLLGLPAAMSEYAPSTFATGQYVGAVGDFSTYWIADSLSMSMQRLVELYAETNQVGIIGRLESDGQPTLPEAFARVKLA